MSREHGMTGEDLLSGQLYGGLYVVMLFAVNSAYL